MTNRIAIGLGAVILAVFLADALFFGGGLPVQIGRHLANGVEYLAFWR